MRNMYYQVVKKQENLLLRNKKAEIILCLCFSYVNELQHRIYPVSRLTLYAMANK